MVGLHHMVEEHSERILQSRQIAAYASRYLAKNVVAAGVSDRCLIQLAYAIGVSKPLSIFIKLANGDEEKLKK